MPTATQANRQVSIGTPLGEDVLLVQSVRVTDSLGQPFNIELTLLTEKGVTVDPGQLIGQNVTVRVDTTGDGSDARYFNGYVSRFQAAGVAGDMPVYQMSVVPFLWLLSRTADCRTYQNKTVPDILKGLLNERGYSDIDDNLTGSYPSREFCVQYRETCQNFISRLMQEEGIYFYFRHENGKHHLVLADDSSGSESLGTLNFLKQKGDVKPDTVTSWSIEQEVPVGSYTLIDYDYTKPKTQLTGTDSNPGSSPFSSQEMTDYPGGFTEKSEGDRLAKVRLQEAQARAEVARGTTTNRTLYAGAKFTLAEHPLDSQNKDWLVTSVVLEAAVDTYQAGPSGPDTHFSCSFTAIPATTPFRPARTAPEPVIIGPQPALVVGSSGEEIYTDKYGRVKVIFQWDRYAKADENASIWIRVAQPSAGKGYGSMFLPRVGQEVLVEFTDGDPDRPVVTGVVYNDSNMPPYTLPDKKTRTVLFRSNSSKGGGGANELSFEDDKGNEQVYLHAEKDYFDYTKNDRKEYVKQNRHLVIKGDQKESVDGDKHLTVKGDQNEKVTGTYSQTVQMDDQHKVSQNYAMDAGMNVHIKAGMNLVIEAGMQITLSAGGAFITVGQGQVVISGPMVMINSGGAAGQGQGASPESAQAPEEVTEGDTGQTEDVPQDRSYTVQAISTSSTAASPRSPSPQAQAMSQASESGAAFVEKSDGPPAAPPPK